LPAQWDTLRGNYSRHQILFDQEVGVIAVDLQGYGVGPKVFLGKCPITRCMTRFPFIYDSHLWLLVPRGTKGWTNCLYNTRSGTTSTSNTNKMGVRRTAAQSTTCYTRETKHFLDPTWREPHMEGTPHGGNPTWREPLLASTPHSFSPITVHSTSVKVKRQAGTSHEAGCGFRLAH
jgi:hypothetical protein